MGKKKADYSKCVQYTIKSNIINKVYIGHTTNFKGRMANHRYDSKNNRTCRSKEIINLGDYYVEYYDFPCKNVIEAEIEEQKNIDEIDKDKLANVSNPHRSEEFKKEYRKRKCKEWYIKNKEKVKLYKIEYNKNNKEKISKQREEFREKNKERLSGINKTYNKKPEVKKHKKKYNDEYTKNNKEKISKQKKEYYKNNKEKIKEYKRKYKIWKKISIEFMNILINEFN